ncbi:tandem-95 repeat protein [Salipiger sp. P9]|uniref:DUF4214 domain-containing protein n=1 Tax=Salipiger pentaromativorans TaxID=2943193 RepID=UPI0021573E9A|nr:DUF4214 domain-containing protein [Salipiger pentaromativorans]MCR8547416.1 tandem-95 repeat protein [Salipiger pentaromativorans]
MGTAITGNGSLVSGLGGPEGYGEIRLPNIDDFQLRVDVSAVFANGFVIGGRSYSATDFRVSTNGFVAFGPNAYYYDTNHIPTGQTEPVIAALWTDIAPHFNNARIYVDVDPVGDVVTITWLDVLPYQYNRTAGGSSFQIQLFDRPGDDFDVVLRYGNVTWGASDPAGPAASGVALGEFVATTSASGDAARSAQLDTTTGNTGQTGMWVFQYLSPTLHAPDAGDVRFEMSEDGLLTLTPTQILASSSDADHDVLSLAAVGSMSNGTLVQNADGSLSIAPAENFNGELSFTFTVSDGRRSSTATARIDVAPVNDAPTAEGEEMKGFAGVAMQIAAETLLANDSDIDGDTLSIVAVDSAFGGTVALNEDGSVLFTPDDGLVGPAGFSYTISDPDGLTATATATVNVREAVTEVTLRNLDGAEGVKLTAELLGGTATLLGDVNGDGRADLLIGGRSEWSNAISNLVIGDNYLVYGRAGGYADLLGSVIGGPAVFLENEAGGATTRIAPLGVSVATGASMAPAGDVNGDGLADFLISSRNARANGQDGAGIVHLVYGQAGGFGTDLTLSGLSGARGATIQGTTRNQFLGAGVIGVGDVNGDGYADIMISATRATVDGRAQAGESYVFFGGPGGAGLSGTLTIADADLVLQGGHAYQMSGAALAGVGDVNGDGIDDMLIGAPDTLSAGTGTHAAAYLVYGSRSYGSRTLDLTALTPDQGIAFTLPAADTALGAHVAAIGDINGDGLPDFAISAEYASVNGVANSGSVYVIFGKRGGLDAGIDLSTLNGSDGFRIDGAAGARLGYGAITAAGDFNNDGIDDLALLSLLDPAVDGSDGTGRAYVIYGSEAGMPATLSVEALNGVRGITLDNSFVQRLLSVAGGGDLNGDGIDDLVLTGSDDRSYIVYGFDNASPISPSAPQLVNDELVALANTGLIIAAADLLANDSDNRPLVTGIAEVFGASHGTVTLTAEGDLRFVPETNFIGEAGFSYRVIDEDGEAASARVTVQVQEHPAPASISGDLTGTVDESAPAQRASGRILVSDPNTGEGRLAPIDPAALDGLYGTFTLSSTGLWSYTIDPASPAFAALDDGDVAVEQLTVQSLDGSRSATINVSVVGRDETELARSGDSFVLNLDRSDHKFDLDSALLSGGSRAVVWTATMQDGSGTGVYLRTVSASGDPVSTELPLATATQLDQRHPVVAGMSNGGFMVAWQDFSGGANTPPAIELRSFNLFGPATGTFRLTHIDGLLDPLVLGLEGGGALVLAQRRGFPDNDNALVLQRFDATAQPVGGLIELPGNPGAETNPALAQLADGSILLTWQTSGVLMMQRLTANGHPSGTPFATGIDDVGGMGAKVTALNGGGYVLSWDATGGDALGVKAQIFDAAGVALTGEILVDPDAVMALGHAVTALDDGGFALAWARVVDGRTLVGLQAFDAAGTAAGAILEAGVIAAFTDTTLFDLLPIGLEGSGTTDLTVYFPQVPEGSATSDIVGQTVEIVLPIEMTLQDDTHTVVEGGTTLQAALFDNDSGFRLHVVAVDGQSVDGTLDLAGPVGTLTITAGGLLRYVTDDPDNQLAKGMSATQVWQVTVEDGAGNRSTQSLEITVLGSGETVTRIGTPGADSLEGGFGDDSLDGLAGNDTLDGGSGADTLTGGSGSDRLTGGAGPDLFILSPGSDDDVLTDFDFSEDSLDLSAFDTTSLAAWQTRYDSATGNRIVTLAEGGTLTFEGIGVENFAPTGSLQVTGTAQQGETLSADASGISDADGLGPLPATLQWLRDGEPIDGATGTTYLLTQEDVGHRIELRYSYTDLFGTAEQVTALAAENVTNVNDLPSGTLTVTGTAQQGETLSADTSGITDADGLGPLPATLQWLRDGEPIDGATGTTYLLTQEDVGHRIELRYSYTDLFGTAEQVTALAAENVTNVNDLPSGTLTVTGTAQQGETLSVDASGISDADGMGPLPATLQWLRDGEPIDGATGTTYLLTQEDVGHRIELRYSYTDLTGTSESVTALVSEAVANVNDAPSGGVEISGAALQGAVLSASQSIGDADGFDAAALVYQWLRDGAPIPGADAPSYTIAAGDIGHQISVRVSYEDGGGTLESLTSPESATVLPETAYGGDLLSGGAGDTRLFGDGFEARYAPDEAAAVYRLYQATFARAPDATGFDNWTERLATDLRTPVQVSGAFVTSTEFQNTYGALDNAGFVALLYQNVLGRAADETGLANWTARLDGGMSRAQVVLGFAQSQEFVSDTQADARAFAEARSPTTWSDEVYRLYQATLDRAPDPTGFANWSGRLADGMPFTTVINSFVTSTEFQNTYGALDNEGFVALLYQNVLGRDADATGLANWTARLDSGMSRAQVVLGFAQSSEFVSATQEDLRLWMLDQGIDDRIEARGTATELAGGLWADLFVFGTSDPGTFRVHDLEPWDLLSFEGFGYADGTEARSHFAPQGADLVFSDQGVTVIFENTGLAALDPDLILV